MTYKCESILKLLYHRVNNDNRNDNDINNQNFSLFLKKLISKNFAKVLKKYFYVENLPSESNQERLF